MAAYSRKLGEGRVIAIDCTTVLKANPYHDTTGAFTSKDKAHLGPAVSLAKERPNPPSAKRIADKVLQDPAERAEFDTVEKECIRLWNSKETTRAANLRPGTQTYTIKRLELHRQIIEKLLGNVDEHMPEPGKAPTMIMLGGRPGSGKTTNFDRDKNPVNGVYDRRKFVVLDADAVKELIPEYDPQKSSAVHEESVDIFEKAVQAARKRGMNVVLDFTMSSDKTAWAKSFKKAGYRTEAYYIYRPAVLAAETAIQRWRSPVTVTKLDGSTQVFSRGRIVPINIVMDRHGDNEKWFDKLTHSIDKWALYDNSSDQFHVKLVAESSLKHGYEIVLKSNPYHDETGAFTSKDKAASVVYFHGTSVEAAKSIKENGLKLDDFRGKAWASDSETVALSYAIVKTNREGLTAVVVLKSEAGKFFTKLFEGDWEAKTKTEIPPNLIEEVRIYKASELKKDPAINRAISKERPQHTVTPVQVLKKDGRIYVALLLGDVVQKENPYHDETGAFTSKEKAHTGPVDVSGWKQVGPQGGSNPGGVFEDSHGVRHYVKFPQRDPEQANAEKLADDIYRELDIPVKDSQLVEKNGKNGLAGKMLKDSHELGKTGCNKSQDVKDGYVADAYLASWDVFGMTYDNILHSEGRDYRVDNGGTLFFRAQGEKKNFPADKVDELDSLIGPGKKGALAFADLTQERIKVQAEKLVTKLTDARLKELVEGANLTGARAEAYLKALIGRRNVIAKRYGIALKYEFSWILKGNPYHDRTGAFTSKDKDQEGSGSDSSSGEEELFRPKDALETLLAGGRVNIAKEDVLKFLKKAAKQDEDPDLTDVHVEGMLIFGGNGLGIARKDMPQIPKDQRDQFIEETKEQGIEIRLEEVSPLSLFPTQREISARNVGEKIKKYQKDPSREFPSLLVSEDNYVLDGHHHWAMMAAYAIDAPKIKVKVQRLMLSHAKALKVLRAYAKRHGIKSISVSAKVDIVAVLKANPYKDEKGRFTTKEKAVTGSKDTEKWEKKDSQDGRVLNGIPLETVEIPDFSRSINRSIEEPPLEVPKGMHVSAGVIMVEPDGRVWLVQPKNMYGGYKNTFAKGTVKSGEDLQETAAREVWEETGLVAQIDSHLIDVQRTTSVARFYVGHRIGGAPWSAGKESHAVKLIDLNGEQIEKDLRNVFGQATSDHKVLAALRSTRKFEAFTAVLKMNPYRDAQGLYTSKDKAVPQGFYKTKSGKHLGVDAEGKITYGGKTVGLMANADLLAAGPFASVEEAHAATGKEGLHLNPKHFESQAMGSSYTPKQIYVTPKTGDVVDPSSGEVLKPKGFIGVVATEEEKPKIMPLNKVSTTGPMKGTYINSVTGETIDVATGKVLKPGPTKAPVTSATPSKPDPKVTENLKAANYDNYDGKAKLNLTALAAMEAAKDKKLNSKIVKTVVDVDLKTGNNIVTFDHEFYSNAKAAAAYFVISKAYADAGYKQVENPVNPGEISVRLNTYRVQVKSIHAPKAVEKPKEEQKIEAAPKKELTEAQKTAKQKYNEKQLAKYTKVYKEAYITRTIASLDLKAEGQNAKAKQQLTVLANAEKPLVTYGITPEALSALKSSLAKQIVDKADSAVKDAVALGVEAQKARNRNVVMSPNEWDYKTEWYQAKSKAEAAYNMFVTQNNGLIKLKVGGPGGVQKRVKLAMDLEKVAALQSIAKLAAEGEPSTSLKMTNAVVEARIWGAKGEELGAAQTAGHVQKALLEPPKKFETKEQALVYVEDMGVAVALERRKEYDLPYHASDALQAEIKAKRLAAEIKFTAATAAYAKLGGDVPALAAIENEWSNKAYTIYQAEKHAKQVNKQKAAEEIEEAAYKYHKTMFDQGSTHTQSAVYAKYLEEAKQKNKLAFDYDTESIEAENRGRLKFEEELKEKKVEAADKIGQAVYKYELAKANFKGPGKSSQVMMALQELDHAIKTHDKYYTEEEYKKIREEQIENVKMVIEQQKILEKLDVHVKQTIDAYDAEDATFKYPSPNDSQSEHMAFKAAQTPQIAQLTSQEKNVFSGFTGSGYTELNKKLGAAAKTPDGKIPLNFYVKAQLIDSAMKKVKLGRNIRLTRVMASKYLVEGLGLKKMPTTQAEADALVGRIYTENAVSSTSMRSSWSSSYSSAANQGAVRLMIRAGKERHGIRVITFTSNTSEEEVTLPRGATYVIRKVVLSQSGHHTKIYVDYVADLPKPLKSV